MLAVGAMRIGRHLEIEKYVSSSPPVAHTAVQGYWLSLLGTCAALQVSPTVCGVDAG